MALSSLLLISLGFLAHAQAEDKFDPVARAKAVAPFIDANTFVVIRVDVTRVNVDALFEVARRLTVFDDEEAAKANQAMLRQCIDLFLKAGCKDLYVVLNHFDLETHHPLLIIPLPSGTDEKSIAALLPVKKREGSIVLDTFNFGKPVPDIAADARPELTAAFEAAGDAAVQAIFTPPKYFKRVVEEIMPQLPKEIGGGEGAMLTKGCLWAAVGLDLPPQISAKLVIQSLDATAADALRAKWIELLKLGPQWWKTNDAFHNSLAMPESLSPETKGSRLVLSIDNREGKFDKMLEDVRNIFEKERESAVSGRSHDNLFKISGALQNYYDANKRFPAAAIYSKDGQPLLSWRVAILPYLGLDNLYKQFHLDEPWDSPHNIKLSGVPVAVYLSPMMKNNMTPDKKSFLTTYVVPVGPGTVFEDKDGMTKKDIKNGTSKTIMALEVDEDHAVIWSKPDDLPYDPKEPAKELSNKYGFYALFCDGRITPVQASRPADELRALFSAAGGEKAKNP
jgi:hypothetical protein